MTAKSRSDAFASVVGRMCDEGLVMRLFPGDITRHQGRAGVAAFCVAVHPAGDPSMPRLSLSIERGIGRGSGLVRLVPYASFAELGCGACVCLQDIGAGEFRSGSADTLLRSVVAWWKAEGRQRAFASVSDVSDHK